MVWQNRLAVDGTLTVANPISTVPTNLVWSVAGTNLNLSWPLTHLGWILQAQTNSLATGLNTNWTDWPGSASVTQTNLNVDGVNPTVFFRLRHP